MKHFALALMVVILTGCSSMGQDWSKADTTRQAVMTGLILVDWSQTKYILDDPDFEELNPLISESNVDAYFPVAIAAHAVVSYALPSKYRKWWQYVTIGTQAFCVGRNAYMGVGFGF